MVTGITGWAKFMSQRLTRTALTSKGEQGPVQFRRPTGIFDGIFLKKADALAQGGVAGFALHDAEATSEAHDNEIGFDGIKIQIEQQLEQTGRGTEERHFTPPEVLLDHVKLPPELVEVFGGANALGNLETLEVAGKRAMVFDDAIKNAGALHDLMYFTFEAKMAQMWPVGFENVVWIPAGECNRIELGEGG